MQNTQPTDLVIVPVARELLGVSWNKMAKLLKAGVVRHYPRNPLDNRLNLVSKAEVLALIPRRAEAA